MWEVRDHPTGRYDRRRIMQASAAPVPADHSRKNSQIATRADSICGHQPRPGTAVRAGEIRGVKRISAPGRIRQTL